MKVIMAKEVLIVRNGTEQTIKMPIDLLINYQTEKSLLLTSSAICCWHSEGSKNTTLQAKDIILALNNEPAKYFDQAGNSENIKANYFSNRFKR
jgi:regulator of sigma E protease